MIMDFGKLSIRYLNTLRLYSTREVRRFNQWNKSNEQKCFVIRDLFTQIENLKPEKVDNTLFTFDEQDEIIDTFLNNIDNVKDELKVHPCASMINEAFVSCFDDYFDRSYFIEPCQNSIMFKINDKSEYYWKSLFPNQFYKDEEKILDNVKEEKDVKYFTYIDSPHILYKIVGQRNNKLYPDLITELHTKTFYRNNSETKKQYYKYDKNPISDFTKDFQVDILNNPNVITFHTFDFSKKSIFYCNKKNKLKHKYLNTNMNNIL